MSAPNIPYIGSRISLISKAEIRYEGILYDVNKNDATVTLSKVRSYGTENRPAQKQVQPRNEVYEYIIFRGSDIKDLSVSEMSKAEEISHDPAILLTQSIPPPMSSRQPSTQMPPPPGGVPQQTDGGGVAPPLNQPPPGMPHVPPPGPPTSYTPFPPGIGTYNPFGVPYFGRPPMMMTQHITPQQQPQIPLPQHQTVVPQLISSTQSPRTDTAVPTPTKTLQTSPLSHASPPSISNSPAVISASNIETSTPNDTGISSISDRSSSDKPVLPQSSIPSSIPTTTTVNDSITSVSQSIERQTAQKDDDMQAPPTNHQKTRLQEREKRPMQNVNRSTSNSKGRYRTRGGGPNYRSQEGPPRGGRGRQALRYDSDFDFDSANALFSKESLEDEMKTKLKIEDEEEIVHEELEEGEYRDEEEGDVGNCYDKSLSFFDNISCEANTGNKRSNRSQEYALNTETFGVTSYGPYRGRSRGRPPRGRGNYRGGGGASNNRSYRGGGGGYSRGGSRYNGSYRGRGRGRGEYREDHTHSRSSYQS